MSKKRSSKPSASRTDWARLRVTADRDIDYSDIPPIDPLVFSRAVARKGLVRKPGKSQITLRVDEDVLAWFRASGRGFQTRINTLLRAYMEAHDGAGAARVDGIDRVGRNSRR